jgi:hypothetical protein
LNRRQLLIGGGSTVALGAVATMATLRQMGSSDDYRRSTAAAREPLGLHPDAHELIRFATLAPSGHNTQPWRFVAAPGVIALHPDFTRRTPIVDPDDHHLYVSLGCAAETLAIAADARGLPGELTFDPQGAGAVAYTYHSGTARSSALCDAIPRRQSTRADYDGRAVGPADLAMLASLGAAQPRLEALVGSQAAGRSERMRGAGHTKSARSKRVRR